MRIHGRFLSLQSSQALSLEIVLGKSAQLLLIALGRYRQIPEASTPIPEEKVEQGLAGIWEEGHLKNR